ncbi:hypothetical protein EV361DRAFT_1014977 [Lentinula raphanica]|nr:hypothetical protein EV361DRAFT_1014977 [Lentinula raphanica]
MKRDNPELTNESIAATLEAWLAEQPGDKMNPLLEIAGLDPSQDTPVEILHTILFGSLDDEQRNLFVVRLQSTDLDGLTVPPLRAAYIMQYRNNLIGKHFKTLMQTMAFHVHDLVTPAQFALIKSVGELGAMLWIPEIEDMDMYLEDLEIIIGNTLDAFAAVDPAKIINKIKIHLLPHIIPDICRFGPIIRSSTEGFECFNAVFRLCSVFSNGQAPSRDIAQKFSGLDRVKHIISGGYYYDSVTEDWIQAGPRVLTVLKSHPIIQRHLGWIPQEAIRYGHMKTLAEEKRKRFAWSSTKASSALQQVWRVWNNNLSVIAASGDNCKIGSWVAVKSSESTDYYLGRIIELLSPAIEKLDNTPQTFPSNIVTIERFVLGSQRHSEFDLPVLYRPQGNDDIKIVAVEPKDVLFRLSVQHDCRLGRCKASGTRNVIQEHQITSRTVSYIKHTDDDRFILNMYGLHNANLVRKLLPQNLTIPKLLHTDRESFHHEIAIRLRQNQEDKRKRTQERRKATMAANKKKKEARAAEMRAQGESEDEIVIEDDEDLLEDVEVGRMRKRIRVD